MSKQQSSLNPNSSWIALCRYCKKQEFWQQMQFEILEDFWYCMWVNIQLTYVYTPSMFCTSFYHFCVQGTPKVKPKSHHVITLITHVHFYLLMSNEIWQIILLMTYSLTKWFKNLLQTFRAFVVSHCEYFPPSCKCVNGDNRPPKHQTTTFQCCTLG